MKIVELAPIGPVIIRKSARAKRLILRIDQSGKPIVTIPNYVPYYVGKQYAEKHLSWFTEHLPSNVVSELPEGKMIGRRHQLEYQPTAIDQPRSRVQNGRIIVRYPKNLSWNNQTVQTEATKACKRALKIEAEAYLPARLHLLAKQFGYTYQQVRVKAAQSRWGSCSSQRNINLSIWLMQLPSELIDYVLCHELTHLNHMHHQADFWNELSEMIPDYKQRRKALKQYAPRLL